jgi:ABC-type nitrate/sulfonate/bicarbonate transport system permease component
MAASLLRANTPSTPEASDVFWLRAIFALVVLFAWEILARSGLVIRQIVPSVSDIAMAVAHLVSTASFYSHLFTTVMEAAASIALGLAGAVVVAAICGAVRFLREGISPILYYLAPTPKIIFFPIALTIFGVGVGSKIAIGTLSAFFPIAISIIAGLVRVDRVYLDVGRSFKLTQWEMAVKIYVPCLWLSTLTGLRLGAGLAIIGVLLAETKLASRGLGYLAIQYYNAFNITDLYAVLAITFALAGLINWVISFAERGVYRPQ